MDRYTGIMRHFTSMLPLICISIILCADSGTRVAAKVSFAVPEDCLATA